MEQYVPRRSDASTNPFQTHAALSQYNFAEHLLERLHEINQRCIELFVHAARNRGTPAFEFISPLRDLLLVMTGEAQRRAAERTFVLIDFQFRNVEWWRAVRERPNRPRQGSTPMTGGFPRPAAIQLARAALTLAWSGAHADRDAVCVLLGMTHPVAELISTLRFTEIDRIAEHQFRHVRPRWEDRPAVWRKLLAASEANDISAMRDFNLHGLQLLAGELMSSNASAGRCAQ
jgi:hypothetical protein